MAEFIIAELHGRLLRSIAEATSMHFQGLRVAAAHLRRQGLLDSRLAKKLAAVDSAYAVSRHITTVSADLCVLEVMGAIMKVKADEENASKGPACFFIGDGHVSATGGDGSDSGVQMEEQNVYAEQV